MKTTILKENLKKGLNIVEKVTGKNLSLPILDNILLKTEGNFLKLSATDLEIGINFWLLAKTEKQGEILVPGKFFNNFIELLNIKQIALEIKNKKNNILNIEYKNQLSQIKGSNIENFPIIPTIEKKEFIEIDGLIFYKALTSVIEVVSFSQNHPEISGIFISFQKNLINIVGTDGSRLSEKKIYIKNKLEKEYSIIVPLKTIQELIYILNFKKDKLRIYFSQNQVLFEFLMEETNHPLIQVISHLISGEYPNYQEVIPTKYKTQIILPKDEFINQIKTASLFTKETNDIKLKIKPQNQEIEIFSQSAQFGENKSIIKGQIKGEKIEILFNWKFIINGLSNIEGPEVIFELNGIDGPGVLKPLKDQSYIYILMPIKSP